MADVEPENVATVTLLNVTEPVTLPGAVDDTFRCSVVRSAYRR